MEHFSSCAAAAATEPGEGKLQRPSESGVRGRWIVAIADAPAFGTHKCIQISTVAVNVNGSILLSRYSLWLALLLNVYAIVFSYFHC